MPLIVSYMVTWSKINGRPVSLVCKDRSDFICVICSSEDDLEGLIQGAAMRYQKRAKRSKCKEEDVDDFEKEMNESLTEKVKSIQNRTGISIL